MIMEELLRVQQLIVEEQQENLQYLDEEFR